ncbi:polysaccharide deacetylase family protein [Candidatus Omnitrophota bacterium]
MKILKKILIVLVVAIVLVASFYVFYLRPRYVVPILMYHSISDEGGSSLHVTPENFSRQITFLKEKGCNVISLDEFVEGKKKGVKFPHDTVVITFDDGYENNYLYAFPVLAKYDMPATIFVITNYVDKRKEYVTWDQVRLMMTKGIDFGGHTRNDVYLPSVKDSARLRNEVAGPKKDIESNTGKEARYFCYPTGGFNDQVKLAVKESGYKGACTTNRGMDRFNHDVYEINRVKVTNSDMTKPFHFRAKLSGYYNLFRSLKSPE